MRRQILVLGVLAVAVVLVVGLSPPIEKVERFVERALEDLGDVEPDGEGPISNFARGELVMVHDPNPSITVVHPQDGETFDGEFILFVENWINQPERAVPAGTQFANGNQERNAGHAHSWIFDMETGQQVRFTGASTLIPNELGEGFYSAEIPNVGELPPGMYKAFFQLQNNDHTPAVPATAPSFPAIDSVVFFLD